MESLALAITNDLSYNFQLALSERPENPSRRCVSGMVLSSVIWRAFDPIRQFVPSEILRAEKAITTCQVTIRCPGRRTSALEEMNMPEHTQDVQPSRIVSAAINRVLKSENDARKAVETCRRDVRHLENEARSRSTRILERADSRIHRVHQRQAERVARRLAALQVETDQIPVEAALDPETRSRIAAAVQQLAEEMTTDDLA